MKLLLILFAVALCGCSTSKPSRPSCDTNQIHHGHRGTINITWAIREYDSSVTWAGVTICTNCLGSVWFGRERNGGALDGAINKH